MIQKVENAKWSVKETLLSLITAGIIGAVVFLWDTNATIKVLQSQGMTTDRNQMEMKGDINQMKLDIRDLRDKAIRAENKENNQNKNSTSYTPIKTNTYEIRINPNDIFGVRDNVYTRTNSLLPFNRNTRPQEIVQNGK